jgi:hypothetical protein
MKWVKKLRNNPRLISRLRTIACSNAHAERGILAAVIVLGQLNIGPRELMYCLAFMGFVTLYALMVLCDTEIWAGVVAEDINRDKSNFKTADGFLRYMRFLPKLKLLRTLHHLGLGFVFSYTSVKGHLTNYSSWLLPVLFLLKSAHIFVWGFLFLDRLFDALWLHVFGFAGKNSVFVRNAYQAHRDPFDNDDKQWQRAFGRPGYPKGYTREYIRRTRGW